MLYQIEEYNVDENSTRKAILKRRRAMGGKMKVRSINEFRGKSIILYHLYIPLQRLPIKKNFAHLYYSVVLSFPRLSMFNSVCEETKIKKNLRGTDNETTLRI